MHSAQSQICLHIRILRIGLEKRILGAIEALFLIWINHKNIEDVDPRIVIVVVAGSRVLVPVTDC